MATYFTATWHHDHPDEPVVMWHELDEARNDLRAVEDFRDGTRLRADQEHRDGETRLSEKPLPSLEDMAAQAEFSVRPLAADEFEQVWRSAAYSR